jgi:thymidylate kinase
MATAGFSAALIGADGAGKTTVARALERSSSLRIKYFYMGSNPEAASHSLPTTRLLRAIQRRFGDEADRRGPPDPSRVAAKPKGSLRRALRSLKSALGLCQRLSEEGYRLAIARWFRSRGYIVLYDRHFFADYYAHDIASQGEVPRARRIHGYVLAHWVARPDLTIVLDAPAELLFARKGEGTPELLEQRRREYLDLAEREPCVAIVDASQPSERVVSQVERLLRDFAPAARAAQHLARLGSR